MLNRKTGRPVTDAPKSMTEHAATCRGAGLLAKLALLRGAGTEEFMQLEAMRAWCDR